MVLVKQLVQLFEQLQQKLVQLQFVQLVCCGIAPRLLVGG